MRKLRYGIKLLLALGKRYRWLLFSGIFLGAIFFWLFPRIQVTFPKFRKTKTIGIIGRYNESNIPKHILEKISIGLTQIDEQGKPYPGLAQKWQSSNEGRIWTFDLNPQITWSNSQPIKANELTFNFKDVKIQYPNNQQIHFQLQDPFSPFPSVVSSPILRKDYLGIGPYKIKKIKRRGNSLKSINLSPISKESLLPNLHYIFYGTEEAAKIAFKLGEIDTVVDLINISQFANWPNIHITKNENPNRYVGLFFNLKNPNFKEKSFRQALAYAIQDKTFSLPRVLGPIMDNSWAYNPHIKPYEYDLKRAQKLWGDFKLDGSSSQIQLATVSSLLPVAESIAANWDEFGLSTQVRVINSIPEDFEVLLVTQEVPTDPDQYVLWHSTQSTNLTNYQSPKVDKLLEDGRKTLNEEKRLEIYQDFQRTLVEDLPVIFLFRPVTYTITRK